MKRAVFLDRDGVLNRSILVEGNPKPPKSIKDIEILQGVVEAIQILKSFKFIPVVVTNQPDVARGLISQGEVAAMNKYIGEAISVKHFYTCFHDDADMCKCRKPLPGLILQAAFELDLNVDQSCLVGDRWRDIQAGQTAGCQNYFIDHSYSELQPNYPYTRVSSLLEAVKLLTEGGHENH